MQRLMLCPAVKLRGHKADMMGFSYDRTRPKGPSCHPEDVDSDVEIGVDRTAHALDRPP